MLSMVLAGLAAWRLSADWSAAPPETRALAYLAREVPLWSRANHCYSCHHNGDAARALYRGRTTRFAVPATASALADTTAWLTRPERWQHNGGDGVFSDKRLARVQFAYALSTAFETGSATDRGPLLRAAANLRNDQRLDGSWRTDAEGESNLVASPATYGTPLATAVARRILDRVDPEGNRDAIARAEAWLAAVEPRNVPDASAVLLGLPATKAYERPRARARDLLHRAQGPDGGWGPFVQTPPEPFDTAIAMLALASQARESPEERSRVGRGRSFLVRTQLSDGSWPETTRPARAESFAERLSTAGWTTLALLEADALAPP